MAQRVQVLFEDDLDGSEAEGTVRFGLDGADYEIDLNTMHAADLRKVFEPYVAVARKVTLGKPARKITKVTVIGPSNTEVRAWAKGQGIEVNDRGRIPLEVIQRFKDRHKVPAATFQPAEPTKDGDKPSESDTEAKDGKATEETDGNEPKPARKPRAKKVTKDVE